MNMKVDMTIKELLAVLGEMDAKKESFKVAKTDITENLGEDGRLHVSIVVSKPCGVKYVDRKWLNGLEHELAINEWRVNALTEIVKTFDITLLEKGFLDQILREYSTEPHPDLSI